MKTTVFSAAYRCSATSLDLVGHLWDPHGALHQAASASKGNESAHHCFSLRGVARHVTHATFLIAAIAMGPSSTAMGQGNLLQNGDFEIGGYSCGGGCGGGCNVPGWSALRVDFFESGGPSIAYSGDWFIDLNQCVTGWIHQDISTTPGRQYSLRFAGGVAPVVCGPVTKSFRVTTGNTAHDYELTAPAGTPSGVVTWTPIVQAFVATADTTNIRFDSLVPSCQGAYIDAVIVSECGLRLRSSPELAPFSFSQPATWSVGDIEPGSGDATITISAAGSLGGATQFLSVRVDGMLIASVFGAGSGATSCASVANSATVQIPQALFTALASDGALDIRIEPSLNATSAGCANATLRARLEYVRPLVDCDGDSLDDECQSLNNDCNSNGVLDSCEIASGSVTDVNANGRPDECEVDCNGNDLPDSWEISQDLVPDCNQNGIPDACDIAAGGTSTDVDANGVPDDCKADCNNNALPDAYEIAQGLVADCDNNAVPDSCQIATAPGEDCNADGILDSCQGGPDGSDCDENGIPDVCDIQAGAEDSNSNGRLDICELRYGDLNLDGQVNGTDLAGLLAVWGLPNPPYGDLDGDGQVGGADLSFLLARWGPVP
jgi:hypothetical protein